MKNLLSPGTVVRRAADVARRFPLAVAYIATLAVLTILVVHGFEDTIDYRLYVFLVPALCAAVAVTLALEDARSRTATLLAGVGLAALWGLRCVWLPGDDSELSTAEGIEIGVVAGSAFFACFFAPFLGNDPDNDTRWWNFTLAAGVRLLLGWIFAGILFGGLMLALYAVGQLFGIDVPEEIAGDTAVACWIVFAPLYVLAGLPEGPDKRDARLRPEPVMKVLALYILGPIMALYALILYVYLLKIVFTWTLPDGGVAWLVTALATGGLAMTLLLYPLRTAATGVDEQAKRVAAFLGRWTGVIIAPLLVLMTVAIARRLGDYGPTVNRIYILLLNIWFYAIYALMFVSHGRLVKWILISATAVAFVVSIGPWSVANITRLATSSDEIERRETAVAGNYRDASLPVDERVADLMGRMTIEEKVGQLTCMLGWEMYEKNRDGVAVSEKFREAVRDRHVGMLWATLRADPWTQKTLETGLDPALAAEATNALQRYAIENSRLGIPLFIAEEAPHGHMAIGTTVFPTSIGQASTWNPRLAREMAELISLEVRSQGAHIAYGPVLDLAREPRWSRVEETYGEDPVLAARMGEAVVQGLQGEHDFRNGGGVISTLKHFAAYGDPDGGHNGGATSIGERDLRQNHLYPFEAAVRAGAGSVMSAYNSIDGIPCTANEMLLTEILRDEWGFEGFTVSDLGSIEGIAGTHRVAADVQGASLLAIEAGLDVDLGGNAYSRSLARAAAQGRLDVATLDRAVARVLRMKFAMGLFENPYVDANRARERVGTDAGRELARRVARESIVLLKNEGNLLPLDRNAAKHIAVIGPNADNIYNQLGDYTAPQRRERVTTVLDGIRRAAGPGTRVSYVRGCAVRDTTRAEIAEAAEAARRADVAVVVVGGSSARDFRTEYESTGAASVGNDNAQEISDMESGEGFDRSTLTLMGRQEELLRAVHATGTPMVVIYIQGRPLDMNWAAANVPALLCAWYPGGEGGAAVADVLFGEANPAGRLPVSVPRSVGQLPVYYNHVRPSARDYVEETGAPLYAFGYGLSYTRFEYSRPSVSMRGEEIEVSLTLRNAGPRDGDEVVQVYISPRVSSTVAAARQLRAFERVSLKAGERRRVTLTIDRRELAVYNRNMKRVVEPGTYDVTIGGSSDKAELTATMEL